MKISGECVVSLQTSFFLDRYFILNRKIKKRKKYFPQLQIKARAGEKDEKHIGTQTLVCGPDSNWASIMQCFFSAITMARKHIYIVSPYFTPNESVLNAIKIAALGNIDVRIMLPEKSDTKIAHYSTMSYVGELLEAGVKIYPQVYVGDGVRIGAGTTLYPGVKIYEGCQVGKNCIIHAGAVIGADGFGFMPKADGSFDKIPQLGNVIIEDNVEIGANTCIDRAKTDSTIIRKGVKLDNLIQVGHNVEIGENTVSSAQMGIAGSSKVGKNCFLAGQVGIADHVTVGNNVKIGSQSGIDKNVGDGEICFGTPALPGIGYHRSFAVFKTLPDLQRRVAALEKELKK
jgi:acyl-[acyl carrier protein]--UDP-N-acetylglucosamine O-acyltransferase